MDPSRAILMAVCPALALLAGCRTPPARLDPTGATGTMTTLSLVAEYIVPRPAVPETVEFGGISGLAAIRDGRELLAVADDRDNSRVYRLRVVGEPPHVRIEPSAVIRLTAATGAPAKLDPEAIAVTSEGHMLISSEGVGNEEPRVPPGILEYSSDGRFIRQLEVRPRYAPNARGAILTGVRDNGGFESLTLSPDGRLFSAVELPLAQDGDATPFAPGSRTRLLEYVPAGGTFRPAREFAYDIEPLDRPPFDVRIAVNGVVELLALDGADLLALERGYVESVDRSRSVNRIRLFRVSLAGATDISGIASLRSAGNVVPVRKTLLLDLNQAPGLSAAMGNLDNFEGMAWGPGRGGRRHLVIVSDDNYSARQVTAFLFLRPSM